MSEKNRESIESEKAKIMIQIFRILAQERLITPQEQLRAVQLLRRRED